MVIFVPLCKKGTGSHAENSISGKVLQFLLQPGNSIATHLVDVFPKLFVERDTFAIPFLLFEFASSCVLLEQNHPPVTQLEEVEICSLVFLCL